MSVGSGVTNPYQVTNTNVYLCSIPMVCLDLFLIFLIYFFFNALFCLHSLYPIEMKRFVQATYRWFA